MVEKSTADERETLKARQSRIGWSNINRAKSYERRCARLLSDWAGVEFRRRRVSGRGTSVISIESTADIIPVHGSIIFSIEVKCAEATSIDGLLANPVNNKFTKWWHQACYDAQLASTAFGRKMYPLLLFKPGHNHDWVAIAQEPFLCGLLKPRCCDYVAWPSEADTECPDRSPVWFPHLGFDVYRYLGEIAHNVKHTRNKRNERLVPIRLEPLFMCRWRDFAKYVEPRSIFVD